MAHYVDGFVVPVPKKKRASYIKIAQLGRNMWLDNGALEYRECVADDVKPGKTTSFPQSVKLKKGEEVWFSWIVYKSRRHCDAVMKKAMSDPRMTSFDVKKMPFDAKRMFFGGFAVKVSS